MFQADVIQLPKKLKRKLICEVVFGAKQFASEKDETKNFQPLKNGDRWMRCGRFTLSGLMTRNLANGS